MRVGLAPRACLGYTLFNRSREKADDAFLGSNRLEVIGQEKYRGRLEKNGGAIVHQGLLRFLVDGQKNLRRAYGGCDIERAALESRSEMRKSDSTPIRIHHSRFMRIAPLLLRESSSSLSPWVLSVKTNFLLLPRRRGNCSLCVLQSPRTRSDVRQGRSFRPEFSSNVIVIGELR